MPNGTAGAAYSQQFCASPAGGNYTYTVTAGTLPAGLSLNLASDVLSGTPATNGTFNFTVTVTGFGSCTGGKAFTLTVGGGSVCPSITLADLPNGAPAQFYNSSVRATPSGSYSYAVTSGSLRSSDGQTQTVSWGTSNAPYRDLAVPADFDGDGKADVAVWRESEGRWYVQLSSDGAVITKAHGQAGDTPLVNRPR